MTTDDLTPYVERPDADWRYIPTVDARPTCDHSRCRRPATYALSIPPRPYTTAGKEQAMTNGTTGFYCRHHRTMFAQVTT